jgi:guanylate kinase
VIECAQLQKAKLTLDEHGLDCNVIYVQPCSIEELSNRVIRNRPGTETKDSLQNKMNFALKEMEFAKRCDWIERIFTNDKIDEFTQKATVHLMFILYKLK